MDFQMPQPGTEHQNLRRLCGNYAGDEVMLPSPWNPERAERTCILQARMLENFFVISDYEQRCGDEVTFRGHGVYSWDPQASCYKMHWFDSMGGAGCLADGQMTGDVLTFQRQSPMGHHRYRYTFYADHTWFEMAMSQDGENWQNSLEGRYRPI